MAPRHPFFRFGYPFFLIICIVLTGTALQAQPAVDNPDFQNDNGFFRVASGWTSFGGNKWEAVWDPQRSFTQGVTDVPPGQMAGVYQQIAVSPGQQYRVSVDAKSNRPGMRFSLGIDPAGGRQPAGAQFADFSAGTDWQRLDIKFTAAGPTATLYLAGFNPAGSYLWGVWAQFDGVAIESTAIANTPPTAVAAAEPTAGSSPLLVQFAGDDSFDPDGDPLVYSWNFGDGSPVSREPNPAHLFTADGTYSVVLTVDDGRGGINSAGLEITVGSEPVLERVVNGDFSRGLYGWSLWRERGGPGANVGPDGRLHLAGTGFNGGLYQQIITGGAGTRLTVDGVWASDPTVAGAQWAEVLIINGPRLPADGQDLNTAQPDVLLIYKSDSWAYPGGWQGAMAETASVKNSATFTAEDEVATIILKSGNLPGIYSGTRFDGISMLAAADPGEPDNHPPVASAAANPASGQVPLTVQFTAAGSSDPDGDPLSFSWDFGDGHSATGLAVSYTYETVGSFSVILTADDGRGGTDAAQVAVLTSAPDDPGIEIEWDERLTQLGIFMLEANVPAGTGYWKLIRADFLSDGDILPPPGGGSESDGKHAIFYRALDINGNPIDGQAVIAAWPTGSPGTFVEHHTKGPGIDDYWGNFALYGGWCPYYPTGGNGPYGAYVAGASSDQVWGMGLPCSRHVSYRLTWQFSIK
jgi:PKD repeat protein